MIGSFVRYASNQFGFRNEGKRGMRFADPIELGKAENSKERFREVICDPLNLAIEKVPQAGFVDNNGLVTLHNGNKVPISGEHSYYGEFSDLLIFNRGVHEPLEEYCFQRLLKVLPTEKPNMLELGAYWAHYSMWLKRRFPSASVTMVEPESKNLEAGRSNFETNGLEGRFINELVGNGHFVVDDFMEKERADKLTILHSDIQGFEEEMLAGARKSLSEMKIDYVFVSTHGEEVHRRCIELLGTAGYVVEVDSEPLQHTTSYDGFLFASSIKVDRVFEGFTPLGRIEILNTSPKQVARYLTQATGD